MTSNLNLSDFHPVSKLVVKQTILQKPHCRVIDAHKHLGVHFGGGWANKSVSELIDRLDEAYVDTYVDLDGGWGEKDYELLSQNNSPNQKFVSGSSFWNNRLV